ncbi:MAG TPA: hypothetical protein VFZ25_10400, partial [Chloroflexota bacterium]|nr:hypothetical protein [Chloroflexota bacterium]
PLPDLYAGAALQVAVRLGASESPRLRLSGKRGKEKVTLNVEAAGSPLGPDEPLIARYWAQQRLDQLLEARDVAANRAAIIDLSRASGIVTPLTALLAVDRVTGDPVPTRRVIVATPLPPGLEYGAFASSANRLAAAAPMHRHAPMQLRDALFENAPSAPPPPAGPRSGPREMFRKMLSSSADGLRQRSVERSAPPPVTPSTSVPGAAPTLGSDDLVSLLRALLREQNADGSWGNAVEATAAALVAFARTGETPTRGSYRRALDRARRWLDAHAGTPEELLFRAWVLAELGTPPLTGETAALLPASASPLAAALHARLTRGPLGGPAVRAATSDYRLAAVSGCGYAGRLADLDLPWRACIRAT